MMIPLFLYDSLKLLVMQYLGNIELSILEFFIESLISSPFTPLKMTLWVTGNR